MAQLTDKQMRAIEILSKKNRGGFKTLDEVAEACGVSVRTIYNWRHDDSAFQNALKKRIMSDSLDHMPEIVETMTQAWLEDRNASVLKLILQSHNMLSDSVVIENKGAANGVDINEIRARLLAQQYKNDSAN